jgi:ribonucleoside-triphosphate reductase
MIDHGLDRLTIKCAEQSLEPYETCCLSEIFLPNIKTQEEFIDVATLLYRVCKHSLVLPAHHPETDAVVHKNMRMGIGITGVMQATKEQLSWLDPCYQHLRDFDKRYSELNGFNRSIKLTTCKPSGTLSLLPGVTPGVHPGYAQYMFRRIRIAANHELVAVCKSHGYPVEFVKNFDGSEDYGTVVVTFPFSYPETAKLAKDTTALDQLNMVREVQSKWSDNSVSCTVYYKPEELPAIKEHLLKHYKNNYKTLSFLLHSEHGFMQAPYQEINQQSYELLVENTKIIESIDSVDFDSNDECASGHCPVK